VGGEGSRALCDPGVGGEGAARRPGGARGGSLRLHCPAGLTDTAHAEAESLEASLVDSETLDADSRPTLEKA